VRAVSHLWWVPPPGPRDPARWSARWTARLTAPATGTYTVAVAATGRSRVLIDDEVVVDNWTDPRPGDLLVGKGSEEVRARIELDEGSVHDVRVDFARSGPAGLDVIRFGLAAPQIKGEIARAVELARDADAAIVVVGTTTDWESEGFDRASMRLPGRQDDLVRRVAEANRRTVVVLNTGSPVELPWEPVVPAIVQLWFPGEEMGGALADVLFGDADPGGRLPTTFPLRYDDHPARFGYPGEGGKVRYGERVFVGYRAYATRGQRVAFPFGHGLSYTTFAYGDPAVDVIGPLTAPPGGYGPRDAIAPPVVVRVAVDVTNTGDRPGHEVTQLYVRPPAGPLQRPERELKAFAKSTLSPGETRRVELDLDLRAFAAFDEAFGAWRCEAGDHELLIGSGDRLPARAVVTLPETLLLPVR
jgi:beta-glucosidase